MTQKQKILWGLEEGLNSMVQARPEIKQLKMNKPWYDKLVIMRSNPLFQVWNLVNTITCIVSSFQYAYFTAFGLPPSGTFLFFVDQFFEIVFIMDLCLQFFLEYQDERTRQPVRGLYKIAMNYFKGRFMYDAITIIPFAKFFATAGNLSRLFNVIKIVRISKGYYLLSTSKFK